MVIFRERGAGQHAQAAVEAALGIQRRARELNEEAPDVSRRLTMHVGVNSGVASVGATKIQGAAGARWTFTASGPTTNIAARLSSMIEARESVIVSAVTRERLGDAFEFQSLGPQDLKNVDQPVHAYRLVPG